MPDAGGAGSPVSDPGLPIAVVDIDGVLADASHRQHYLDARPRDWDGFFEAVGGDVPITDGVRLVVELSEDHEVVLLSGRPEVTRQETLTWLDRTGVPYSRLLLRRDSDRRPAPAMKAAALARLGPPGRIAVVVDDDHAVIERVTAMGYRGRLFGTH
jgi:beta-phosphoglucomutase-like phosphatase (HAD superfamily)